MARRARSVVVLAVCAGALVACNLIAGLTEDYAVVDPSGDGSPPGSEAGGGESGTLDGASEGSSPSDASDGQVDTDGPVVAFCASSDSGVGGFCDDFETDSGLPYFNWTSAIRDHDAGIAVAPVFGEGSRGLQVYLDQPGASSTAWLSMLLSPLAAPQLMNHFELEVDFSLVALGSGGKTSDLYSAGIAMLTFSAATSPNREFGVAFYGNGSTVSHLTSMGTPFLSITPAKPWHHVLIQLDRPDSATTFSKTVTVDSTTIDADGGIDPSGGDGRIEIRLGVFSTAPGAGEVEVHFDNVLFRQR